MSRKVQWIAALVLLTLTGCKMQPKFVAIETTIISVQPVTGKAHITLFMER